MKIAILMSSYNGETYIDRQLSSLFGQTLADDMIVYIRDDGSTDRTFEIIEKWKNKLNIILIKGKNAGPARSFWKLFSDNRIKADYYFFCDQDDIWDSNKVAEQINSLKQGACLSCCNCRIIDSKDHVIKDKRMDSAPQINIPLLFVAGVTQGCSMAFTDDLRRFILTKNPKCILMHDIIVMLYAMTYGKVSWNDVPLFGYRVHEANVVAKKGKSLLKRIKTTYRTWKNSSRNSMAVVAEELLKNGIDFSEEDKQFLKNMSNYKSSIKAKLYVLNDKRANQSQRRLLNSYKMRILLNLL